MRKALELEKARGFRDTAVIGGLDRLLGRLGPEVTASGPGIAEMLSPGYAGLSPAQRRRWMESVLVSLETGGNIEPPRSPSPSTRTAARAAPAGQSPEAPITILPGIRSGLADKFGKLGVKTVRDMLYFFPRRHIDYSQRRSISGLEIDSDQTVIGHVWEARVRNVGGRMRSTEAIIGDETGNVRVVWFNQPYLAKKLKSGDRMAISGKVSLYRDRPVFESPEYEILESDDLVHTGRLVPVYPLTEGLASRTVRRLVKSTVDGWSGRLTEFMPEEIARRNRLMGLSPAIRQVHYPESEERKEQARRRLAFDELLLMQLSVMTKRRDWQGDQPGHPMTGRAELLDRFLGSLPYSLTTDQQRVLREILGDMARPRPMSRLLQGEVGSGKTVVAVAATVACVSSGFQAAIMAPTEILAEQHFRSISALLSRVATPEAEETLCHTYSSFLGRPLSVALLTGSARKSDRSDLQQRILRGDIDIAIGTHALIQEGIEFGRLGLAIVDEQHRFGVLQRSALRQKGFNPHLLVMTATPIPRTLALTLYGDLDLSVINQLPPGRQRIKTKWVGPDKRERAYEFLRGQVHAGRQAFIICPLIEESEAVDARAAVAEHERLSSYVFPDLRLGLLHGRMPAAEKDETMRRFRDGGLDILVSTAVVEVGIDVPNATVMLVEGADRFGLSQLHQFRGRVGRGAHQSYCLLLSDSLSREAKERLTILERTDDGFKLAEEDLKLRGPGEFFGTRQSGLPDLRLARLSDTELIEMAHREAIALFESDPMLEQAQNRLLAQEVSRAGVKGEGDLS